MKSIGLNAISYVGTTLLSMILGSHPDCRSVGHCYVFFYPFNKKKRHITNKENVCSICNLLNKDCNLNYLKYLENDFFEDIYRFIYDLVLEKEHIIIDSSSNIKWFRRVKPDYLIWVFRDPVSLASSYKKRGFGLDYMIKAYNKTYPAQGIAIDYKNFIQDTKELRGLFSLIGIEFSPDYLEYWNHDNHMVGGNDGVLLNYAKVHRPDKVDEIINRVSCENKHYKLYYKTSRGNFDGSIDILTDAEKQYVKKHCEDMYIHLQSLEYVSLRRE